MRPPILSVSYSASGAAAAGEAGNVVVIVDPVDMATTCEEALANGAVAVFGAAPAGKEPPVKVDPKSIGRAAGQSVGPGGRVVIFAEPRHPAPMAERAQAVAPVIAGIEETGARVEGVHSNVGFTASELCELEGRAVVVVSHAGGVCYDAATQAGAASVLTATIIRGHGRRGWESASIGVERAINEARTLETGITYVASSPNAPEDVIGAAELARLTIEKGFLDFDMNTGYQPGPGG